MKNPANGIAVLVLVLNVCMRAVDASGNDSGLLQFDTWTLNPKTQ